MTFKANRRLWPVFGYVVVAFFARCFGIALKLGRDPAHALTRSKSCSNPLASLNVTTPCEMTLTLWPDRFGICRLEPEAAWPSWATQSNFYAVTRTTDEWSVVCPEAAVPEDVRVERGWRVLKVEGPLDFALTGVLASLAGPLAEAGVSLFALSTYDTDYLLVKEDTLDQAVAALAEAGHRVEV